MKEKLRAHIDALFENAPKTRKAFELKEELLSNLNARYDDLVSQGWSEEDAYNTAVAGIGDVGELIAALGKETVFDYTDRSSKKKKSALLISISVGLYIISIIPLLILQNEIGVIAMLGVVAVATVLIIYNGMSYSRYRKADDTVVEDFKEWKSSNTEKVQLRKSISAILWPLIVVIYFLVSFTFGAWAYSWVIFILGISLQHIIRLVIDLRE